MAGGSRGRRSPARSWTGRAGVRRRRSAPGPARRAGPAAADRGPDAGRRPEPGRDDAAAGADVAGPADPAAPLACPRPPGPPGGPARLAPGAQDHWLRAARSRPAALPAAHLHAGRGRPGPPALRAPGGRRRPAAGPGPAGTQRSSLVRSSAGMAVGTLVSRGTGFLRTLVLVVRDRHRPARQRVQQRQHAAEHRLLPDARRHLHQRGGAAAGPGGPARPGPRRGLRAADVHPGRGGPAGGHRAGDAAGGAAGQPVRATIHGPRPTWPPSTT